MALPVIPLKLSVPQACISAIGHVITQWAYLEAQVDEELAWMRKRPECAHIERPRSRTTFSKRVEAWRQMCLVVFADRASNSDANFIAGKACWLKTQWDQIAHGLWGSRGRK